MADRAELARLLAELTRLADTCPAGTRLPAERELAARFGVGRAHLRRALRELEHTGWIHTRAQSGSYVRRRRLSSPAP